MQRLSKREIFTDNSLSRNLGQKSVKGGVSTICVQIIKLVLRTGTTVILARLLTPADFGIIAMVSVVVNLAAMFKDAGLSLATIQKEQISHEQVSNLFWINLLISMALGLCMVLGAPLVTWFYGKSELTNVTAVLSISFILSGLSLQHAALMRRHMRFGELAFVQVLAQFLSVVTTVILALHDLGYWALVGGALISSLITLLLTYYFCPWNPGKIQKVSGVRDMLKFGARLTGANVVGYLSRNVDNILIGRFIGVDALGVYGRAYSLFMLPVSQIRAPLMNVAMPVLSSLKNAPDRYLKYYLSVINIMATCAIPLSVYCILEGDIIIRVLLGEQWMGAVPVFRILAVAGVIQSISGTRGLVLVSHGFSKRYLRFSVVISILNVGAFIIGIPFGITGVAASFTIINIIILVPSLFYCFSGTPIRVKPFMKTLIPPILISGCSAAISSCVFFFSGLPSFWTHLIFGAVFVSLYCLASICRKSVRELLLQIKKSVGSSS